MAFKAGPLTWALLAFALGGGMASCAFALGWTLLDSMAFGLAFGIAAFAWTLLDDEARFLPDEDAWMHCRFW